MTFLAIRASQCQLDIHFAVKVTNQSPLFTQAAHFYWAMWALVQAHFSTIDFDFLG